MLKLPTLCILCNQSTTTGGLCTSCHKALPWNDRPCWRCGLGDLAVGRVCCESCQLKPPLYARTVAPLQYRDQCARWVVKAKHQSGLVEARLLGQLLATAVLIAEPIQRATRIKLHRRGVQRIRHTPIQPGLGYRERALNINDAFRVRKPWHGETVALIDDVMTTGATASALTAALLQAGVAEVHVWCATRAAAS